MTTYYDAVIVGGSYSGMAAALMLARGYRQVLVLDTGRRRNRFARHAHGVLGQDGRAPGAIADEAREQLLQYPNVTWVSAEATQVEAHDGGFRVTTDRGEPYQGRYLILATGVRDRLPELTGLSERWGRSVFHCPYCHGYELNRGPLGVLATSEESVHQAFIVPDWGPTTFFLNGVFEPSDGTQRELAGRGVTLEHEPVIEVAGEQGPVVHLADGRAVELAGLFLAPWMEMTSPLAGQLGCAMTAGPLGDSIQVDAMQATSVPGVFACGDVARPFGNVTFAMASGTMAGTAVHRALMYQSIM